MQYQFLPFLCALALLDSLQAEPVSFKQRVVDANPPSNPWIKIAGDFNGDGKQDIAIGGSQGPLVWYSNPDWTRREVGKGGYHTVDGESADMDEDGDVDIVIGAEFWFENPGDPAAQDAKPWVRHRISDVRTHDVELRNLDGDGKLDLIARDQSGFGHQSGNAVHLWQRLGPDEWKHRQLECEHGEGIAVVDLDGDEDADIVLDSVWLENSGKPFEEPWTRRAYTHDWKHPDAKVAVGDLNGDKRLDILLSPAEFKGQFYKIAWYERPGDVTAEVDWKEHIVVDKIEAVIHALAIADFNRDGFMDIAAAQMHQGESPQQAFVLWNRDNGAGWNKQALFDQGSHNILVVDVNRDTYPDIIGANHGGSQQAVYYWEAQASR